ncbi:MAG: hypothetical protein AABY33_04100 [Pseudomonadota bacterium]
MMNSKPPNENNGLIASFFAYYQHKRLLAWILVFVLPVILSIATFLWHIEARNLYLSCYPERTWIACFDGTHTHFLFIGIFMYVKNLYLWFFWRLLAAIAVIEIYSSYIVKKVQNYRLSFYGDGK